MKPALVAAVAAAAVGGGALVYVVEDRLDPYPYPDAQPATAPEQPATDASGQDQQTAPEQPVEQPPAEPSAGQPTDSAGLDAGEASQIALVEVPGTVVDTWPGREGGRDVWYVDVRTDDGDVLEVYVDATTGDVLEVEPD